MGFQINCGGVSVLYYRKIKSGEIIIIPLVSSVGLRGFIFEMPGNVTRGELHKAGK